MGLFTLLSERRRAVPAPAPHHAALGDHPVELEVPRVARQSFALLQRVAEANQAHRPERTRHGAVVVPATASEPSPRRIPGEQRNECDRRRQLGAVDLLPDRLGNAVRAGSQRRPRLMRCKRKCALDQSRQIEALPSGGGSGENRARRHLVIGREIGDHGGARSKGLEPLDLYRHGRLHRRHIERRKRSPATAHLPPNGWLGLVHPAFLKRNGTGVARSVLSGHALEPHCMRADSATIISAIFPSFLYIRRIHDRYWFARRTPACHRSRCPAADFHPATVLPDRRPRTAADDLSPVPNCLLLHFHKGVAHRSAQSLRQAVNCCIRVAQMPL